MSYEKDYSKPYRAQCSCGKGFVQAYETSYSNDWGQTRTEFGNTKIHCDYCSNNYHIEFFEDDYYLVPNGLSFPSRFVYLDYKYVYTSDEKMVKKYDKDQIKTIIADMTAPKHRYMQDLTESLAIKFANNWYSNTGKKSLKPMIEYLQGILENYDSLNISYNQKQPFVDQYYEDRKKLSREVEEIQEKSVYLEFLYDKEQVEQNIKQQREYKEAHKYDDFQAKVSYDPSYKKDLSGTYFDSYLIKECTDPQYLILNKPEYGTAEILITKKYKCKCQICGKEEEILSSKFTILENDDGFSLGSCCDCHTVSSAEAKAMDILNHLGVTYIREKTFDDLVGDSGTKLRFDFALYKECFSDGTPKIDLLIELQGPHHYKVGFYDEYGDYITESCKSITLEDRFLRQRRYDERKKCYCEQNNIPLLHIKYTAFNSYEILEKKIIEILEKNNYTYLK